LAAAAAVVMVAAGVMLLGTSWVAAGTALLQLCMWLLTSGGSWQSLWTTFDVAWVSKLALQNVQAVCYEPQACCWVCVYQVQNQNA
jgi:hypothetical protein